MLFMTLQPFFYTGFYMKSRAIMAIIPLWLLMKFMIKKSCFIDFEQTGRPRVPYIVEHVDAL